MTDHRVVYLLMERLTTRKPQGVVIPNRAFRGRFEGSAADLTACGIRYGAARSKGNVLTVWHNHKRGLGGKNEAQPLLAAQRQ